MRFCIIYRLDSGWTLNSLFKIFHFANFFPILFGYICFAFHWGLSVKNLLQESFFFTIYSAILYSHLFTIAEMHNLMLLLFWNFIGCFQSTSKPKREWVGKSFCRWSLDVEALVWIFTFSFTFLTTVLMFTLHAVKTNDMMLVIYLSSLIRSVIALHNLINNKVRFAFDGVFDWNLFYLMHN